MEDVYVLNRNLEPIGIIDSYKSLIWANRYRDIGDCELYLPATNDNINLLKKDNYLARYDTGMVCQIKRIEIDTDAENGNFLIVNGYDTKKFLDQRIIWNTATANGNAELFIRSLVDATLSIDATNDRKIVDTNGRLIFYNGDTVGFTEQLSCQISYRSVGEKVREYCEKFGWGYRVIYDPDYTILKFDLYKGTDRSDTVVFSDEYENLITTKYSYDETNLGTIALIAGEGQGAARAKQSCGGGTGVDRYEIFVDGKDITHEITWAELIDLYPNGTIVSNSSTGLYSYKVSQLDILIQTDNQLEWLQEYDPTGIVVTIDDSEYYRMVDKLIADIESITPADDDTAYIYDVIYNGYLIGKGNEILSTYGAVTAFDGSIEPNMNFVYNKDYFLGDTVTIRNQFGIDVKAVIMEVTEVNDDNGYSVEPKFEYIQKG